ncbi:MAG: endolytic transglycosylase MltG [Pseudomonadota bacterium]|nr:endolytic transglycosylase MltG [Pseudomonadota bacterium]
MNGREEDAAVRSAPPRRGSLPLKLLGALLLASLLAAAMGAGYLYHALNKPLSFHDRTYRIESGDSLAKFARTLQQGGVIGEPISLRILGRIEGAGGRIDVGEYRFADGINLQQLLEQVVSGQGQVLLPLLVVEGWTFRQFREQLRKAPRLEQTVADLDDAALMEELGHSEQNPEGRFYPDTYSYLPGDTDISILQRAYDLMTEKLKASWQARDEDLPLESPYEALVLASIVEKETAVGAERPRIAGVFVNRLRRGMLLQTDPTVIYGVISGLGDKFDGNLTRKHLRTDTPYNTYTRKGLPPTPIALPGEAAIEAVLHPDETEALYFVARGDGAHAFSRTLREHNNAVRKYQLGGKK